LILDIGDVDLEKVAEIEVEEHGGYADEESSGGGDHRLADAAGEVGGFGFAGGEHVEGGDHAGDGAEEAEHRADGGEDIEVVHPEVELGFLVGEGFPGGLFHRGFVGEVAFEIDLEHGGGDAVGKNIGLAVTERVGRRGIARLHELANGLDLRLGHHFFAVDLEEAVDADGGGADGAEEQRPHEGAAGVEVVEKGFIHGWLGGGGVACGWWRGGILRPQWRDGHDGDGRQAGGGEELFGCHGYFFFFVSGFVDSGSGDGSGVGAGDLVMPSSSSLRASASKSLASSSGLREARNS
jgi:hypothetical protein